MSENICNFVPYHKDYHSIHTINFVYETKQRNYTALKSQSVYKIYYILEGNGILHTPGNINQISKNDVFFTFPSFPFCIESKENFKYMYISFLGNRANMIMEKLNISNSNYIFRNLPELECFWKKGLEINQALSDLSSESVLLYTFSYIGNSNLSLSGDTPQKDKPALAIKKYIDDNFSNTDFSIQKISSELSYNPKYISSLFKKEIGIGIIEYLNTVRIQQSCTFIKQGFTSVSDIAFYCGFKDPQYFSKVFKSKLNMSPALFIKDVQKRNEK